MGLLHLLPAALVLLAVSFSLWLVGLSLLLTTCATWSKPEWQDVATVLVLLVGGTTLIPAVLALPSFFVGMGLLRRRMWARFVGLYMAIGLGGTGLLMIVAQGRLVGILLLAHAAFALAVLLMPRFAREFAPSPDSRFPIPDSARR